MRIDVLTLFPEMFESVLNCSILKRAQDAGLVDIVVTNIRDFALDKHHKVDDKPYGGGAGMVMMPGPVFGCVEHVEKLADRSRREGVTTRLLAGILLLLDNRHVHARLGEPIAGRCATGATANH